MNRFDTIVTILTVGALAAYAGAFGTLYRDCRRLGIGLFAAGWLLNAGIMLTNGWACGEPPFGNMYHVLVFLAFCFFPLYLLMRFRDGLDFLHLYFALAAAIPLVGTLFMERELGWQRVPALQSPWFVPHVVAYVISYALATVAFVLTVRARIGRKPHRGSLFTDAFARPRTDRIPNPDPESAALSAQNSDTDKFDRASYRILLIALPFMTFGMLSGALWAEEAWGVYWSWDAKETWSLLTWTLYLITLHCRLHPRLVRYTNTAHLLAFLALICTFLLVNLWPKIGSLLHTYA